MKNLLTSAFIVFVVSPSTSIAQDNRTSVRDLLRGCEGVLDIQHREGASLVDAKEMGACVGFIRGVTSMLTYACWSKTQGFSPMISAGTPTTTEASIQAFVNWARGNPASWDQQAEDGVILAIMEEWPCEH